MIIDIRHLKEISHPLIESYFSNGVRGKELVENHQHVVLPYADIHSKEWYFDGIRIGYSDWRYHEPVTLRWGFNINSDLVTLFIILKGTLCFSAEAENGFSMHSSQHNLFYSTPGTIDEGLLCQENNQLSMFMVQFPKKLFSELISDANEPLNHFREEMWNGRSAALGFENRYLDIGMRNVIHQMLHCRFSGGMRKIFLLSKVMELLVLQADAFNQESDRNGKIIRSSYDRERIHFVMDYLNQHLADPPSLSSLSRIAGINEFKLKKGFKEIFGSTVFSYIAEARLKLALDELMENQKSVSEVASLLGYSSVNHFSSAFKKKYGLSPSQTAAGLNGSGIKRK